MTCPVLRLRRPAPSLSWYLIERTPLPVRHDGALRLRRNGTRFRYGAMSRIDPVVRRPRVSVIVMVMVCGPGVADDDDHA